MKNNCLCFLLLGLVLFFYLFIPPNLVWADCERARDFYNQAQGEEDPARKKDLLTESLNDCGTFGAFFSLAGVQLEMGEFKDSLASLQNSLNLAAGPKAEAMALARMAQVFEAQGELEEAVLCLRQSYKRHAFPKVLEKQEELETRLVRSGVTAASIKKALFSRSLRSFGVEPSIDLRIQFDFDSARLNTQGIDLARELGRALQDPGFEKRDIVLTGHTDKRGTLDYNQNLSLQRAIAVKEFLVKQFGFSPGSITAQGRGENELLYPGDSENEHALNRRVEVGVK